jgi:hypothetical protein
MIGPIQQYNFGAGYVPASAHLNCFPNGEEQLGGMVAGTAYAGPRTYIAPEAVVYDMAIVDNNSQVMGHARVHGLARVCGDSVIWNHAAVINGHAIVRDCNYWRDHLGGCEEVSGNVF